MGVGFSSAGTQAEQVIRKVFDALPDVKKLAFNTGMVLDGNKLIVVDTNKGWILEGGDAAAYVQADLALLSLLINVILKSEWKPEFSVRSVKIPL